MIKILTLLGNNYGGCLQAYALYNKIKTLGYEAEHINYTEYLSKKVTLKRIGKSIIYKKRNNNFSKFKSKYLNIGKQVDTIIDDGSNYIVGSDQVWNSQMSFDVRKNFFLSFVKDKKRKHSYAASIGTDYLDKNKDNVDKIKSLLKDFDKITVREKTAEELIKKIGINNVETVLDPTLLMNADEWKRIIKKYNKNNYVLTYTLGFDDKNDTYIENYCKSLGLNIVDVFYKKRFNNTLKVEKNFGPIEFISSIYYSNFVITNSFHGTVFSLLFHKEFITITRGNMNSRIMDLLKKVHLEDRIILEEDLKNLNNIKFKKIDYENVDSILEKERKKSIEILKTML